MDGCTERRHGCACGTKPELDLELDVESVGSTQSCHPTCTIHRSLGSGCRNAFPDHDGLAVRRVCHKLKVCWGRAPDRARPPMCAYRITGNDDPPCSTKGRLHGSRLGRKRPPVHTFEREELALCSHCDAS
eukprot:3526360-Prymnesium_polylepis.2